MQRFYEESIGLTLMKRFPHAAFFRVGDGYQGHTQILALFDRTDNDGYSAPEQGKSSLDHFAFAISLADFANEQRRLESLGLNVSTVEHAWVKWRSIYVDDPEGNVVELVCYDETVT